MISSPLPEAPVECVLLFDIDGTLIESGGAGGSALLKAAREHFARHDIQAVPLHGRTDRGIMTDMLETAGISANVEDLRQWSERYFRLLPSELALRGGRILPGVIDLLELLADDSRFHLGIVTGNMPESAQIKLEHFGLWRYFKFGVFGHQAATRRELSEPAWQRIRERATQLPAENVVIIGDTVLDVDLALTMQVRCLAVCTGGSEADSLHLAGAHHVAVDLTETERIRGWFLPSLFNQPFSEQS